VTREKLGTTAVGNGIALPHATVDQLQQTTILVASLDQPVDFDSPDGRPVDIVSIVLGAPESQGSYLGAIRFVTDSLNQNADAIRGAQSIAQLEAAMAASREAAA
jgi:PTS system nitrogen regulatory IIA component